VSHRQVGVAWGKVGEVAEVVNDAIPDDQQTVADEARSAVLVAGVLPRVVHEVEEAPADGATCRHVAAPSTPGSDRARRDYVR